MGQPGDINDELDDDKLRQSIETSTKDGQWREGGTQFDDPKLQSLAKQLAEPPRTTYTERRLAELDRRAAEKDKRDAAKAATPAAPRAETKAAVPAPLAREASTWLQTIGPAFALFAAAIVVQTIVQGWSAGLGVRGAIAALAAGIAWKLLGEGRWRSAAAAAGAHLIAFVATGGATTQPEVLASLLGAVIVTLGSGVLGMKRER